MKRIAGILAISAFMLTAPLMLLGQTPPHPNGGNVPGSGNTPVGGAAPIDGGIVMLMVMGAAYGAKKVYRLKK